MMPATGVRMQIRDECNKIVSAFECFPEAPDTSLFETPEGSASTTYAYVGRTDAKVPFPPLNVSLPFNLRL